ncbi:GNAT family N-acetyltransferase [Mucilaginibacter sp. BT774]|uniref:GNAT family N-acetyltransferase n=1 Tax=Mucilaginibacter sp. BT774 TaxID=3062276 RepID=UPI0026757EB8|nr:GNAT family N-acetyltransferase [Mucilaginibacter sp. BT774]MDO3627395.1 GNAT family N-acetyltransferase [Mucilaginibacter sp. BT774]
MNLSIEQIRPELTWRLRQQVLYPAQKLYEMELDEDQEGIHFGAFTDNKLVGIISLFQTDRSFQFRKLAVLSEYQKMGIGNALLQRVEEFAESEGGAMIWCNARVSAIGFYMKAGYEHTGKLFSKNGFDYEILEKQIKKQPAA